jgi:hypothetical protein
MDAMLCLLEPKFQRLCRAYGKGGERLVCIIGYDEMHQLDLALAKRVNEVKDKIFSRKHRYNILDAMPIAGGFSEGLKVDAKVEGAVMDHLINAKRSSGYQSVTDMLVCTVFPEFERPCREFYESRGKKLVALVSSGLVERLENALMNFLNKEAA